MWAASHHLVLLAGRRRADCSAFTVEERPARVDEKRAVAVARSRVKHNGQICYRVQGEHHNSGVGARRRARAQTLQFLVECIVDDWRQTMARNPLREGVTQLDIEGLLEQRRAQLVAAVQQRGGVHAAY